MPFFIIPKAQSKCSSLFQKYHTWHGQTERQMQSQMHTQTHGQQIWHFTSSPFRSRHNYTDFLRLTCFFLCPYQCNSMFISWILLLFSSCFSNPNSAKFWAVSESNVGTTNIKALYKHFVLKQRWQAYIILLFTLLPSKPTQPILFLHVSEQKE